MGEELFGNIAKVLLLSMGVILTLNRVRVPSIVGFLLVGILAGPHGIGLIGEAEEVQVLAEIGVVMLLFVIGLEFSIEELASLKRIALFGGAVQVGLVIVAVMLIALAIGMGGNVAVFVGFMAALSSTAIVLKLMHERAELATPHGRIVVAILIFQDLVVVPMMLLVPFLAGKESWDAGTMLIFAGKMAAMVVATFYIARKVIPVLFLRVLRTRSRELFLLTTLSVCFGVGWAMSLAGLSISLGAFLAGLIISESEYSHHALEGIIPFRDIFTNFFFISIGMLLDMEFVVTHAAWVASASVAVLVLKILLASAGVMLLGYPVRVAVLTGMAIAQVGEFSFVLAESGHSAGLLGDMDYQMFLSSSIITMAVTPALLILSPRAADLAVKIVGPVFRFGLTSARVAEQEHFAPEELFHDHVIIVGCGVGGRHVARAARAAGIMYRTIDLNPDTVRSLLKEGEPVIYGDSTHEQVLVRAGIKTARVLVLTATDPAATRRTTGLARSINPALHIIVRTRFLAEIEPLMQLGANEVIPEEFETSVEIFTRVMSKYLVPRVEIDRFTQEIRSEGYDMLRKFEPVGNSFQMMKKHFSEMDLSAVTIDPGSALDGKTLAQAELRNKYGLTVVAIHRHGVTIHNPAGNATMRGGDLLYVFGTHEDIAYNIDLFTTGIGGTVHITPPDNFLKSDTDTKGG